jgi:divalent metal cation (Fe/Co/Zn/Cd) transporter
VETKRLEELLKVRKILITVFVINVSLSAAKLWLGFISSTLSLLAEGFHSLLDSSANAVAVLGLTASMKPPDDEHPYGHRKFEALSAIAISFFIVFFHQKDMNLHPTPSVSLSFLLICWRTLLLVPGRKNRARL